MKETKRPKVFICYAKEDVETARRIFGFLLKAGADPWFDKESLVPGDDWAHEIEQALASSDAAIVLLRPGFDDVGFRQKEVRLALEAWKLRPPGRGFIIPFVVEPCTLPGWCNPIHAGSDTHKRSKMEDLIKAIEKHCSVRLGSQPSVESVGPHCEPRLRRLDLTRDNPKLR